MVNKGPREGKTNNREFLRYEEELEENPPIVLWQVAPNTGGIQVAIYVYDPQGTPGRKPLPRCDCNLFGSPKRKTGPHHDETCGRYVE